MKIKQSFLYQLRDYKGGVLVYYGVLLALVALFALVRRMGAGISVVFSGVSAITCVFLFICGLCSLHDNLPMHLQNGVSRKTMFQARLGVTAAASAFCALVDNLMTLIIQLLGWDSASLFQQAFGGNYPSMGRAGLFCFSLVFSFVLLVAASCLGYFTIAVFYRLTKPWRIFLGVALALVVGPGQILVRIADQYLFRHWLADYFAVRWVYPVLDYINASPFATMGVWVLAAAGLSAATWLVLRRTPVCR